MKVTIHTTEARDLINNFGEIDEYQRRHIIRNHRRELQSAYDMMLGFVVLVGFVVLCGAGLLIAQKLGITL